MSGSKSKVLSVLVLGGLTAIAGCGGGGLGNISEGPMPEGGSFTGVWHSPQYGEMHLVQTGQQVVGDFTKDERRGRVQGSVSGDVMRFEWSEDREMIAGRPITTRGRGYFRYTIGEDGDHYIRGEWGNDDAMRGGGPWNAVRDRRRQPANVGSQETSGGDDVEAFDSASDGGGDSFDSSSGGSSGSGGGGGDSDLDLGDL